MVELRQKRRYPQLVTRGNDGKIVAQPIWTAPKLHRSGEVLEVVESSYCTKTARRRTFAGPMQSAIKLTAEDAQQDEPLRKHTSTFLLTREQAAEEVQAAASASALPDMDSDLDHMRIEVASKDKEELCNERSKSINRRAVDERVVPSTEEQNGSGGSQCSIVGSFNMPPGQIRDEEVPGDVIAKRLRRAVPVVPSFATTLPNPGEMSISPKSHEPAGSSSPRASDQRTPDSDPHVLSALPLSRQPKQLNNVDAPQPRPGKSSIHLPPILHHLETGMSVNLRDKSVAHRERQTDVLPPFKYLGEVRDINSPGHHCKGQANVSRSEDYFDAGHKLVSENPFPASVVVALNSQRKDTYRDCAKDRDGINVPPFCRNRKQVMKATEAQSKPENLSQFETPTHSTSVAMNPHTDVHPTHERHVEDGSKRCEMLARDSVLQSPLQDIVTPTGPFPSQEIFPTSKLVSGGRSRAARKHIESLKQLRTGWTSSEYAILRRLVKIHGYQARRRFAVYFPHRPVEEVDEKIQYYFPSCKNVDDAWTTEDEKSLLNGISRVGVNWKAVAELMPGRNADNVKRHFNEIIRDRLGVRLQDVKRSSASQARLEEVEEVSGIMRATERPNLFQN